MGRLRQVPRDIWIGLVVVLLAGLYWAGADGLPISPLDGVVNAAAMPKALASALAVLALILIVRAAAVALLNRRALAAARSAAPPPDAPEGEGDARHAHLRAAGMLGLGLLYLVVLPHLGYVLSITLLILGVATYMRARPDRKLLLLAAGIAVFFYLLFVRFLGIPLPPGIWPNLLG